VRITFDPAKRAKTFEERGLDFADARHVFAEETYSVEDLRSDYPETRIQTLGFLAGRMVMVVWTPQGEARHVISMRKCNAREQTKYGPRFREG
jgi:uncharacterized DUF497 family protein